MLETNGLFSRGACPSGVCNTLQENTSTSQRHLTTEINLGSALLAVLALAPKQHS